MYHDVTVDALGFHKVLPGSRLCCIVLQALRRALKATMHCATPFHAFHSQRVWRA